MFSFCSSVEQAARLFAPYAPRISGIHAREIFRLSSLGDAVLAHIWQLSDLDQVGSLSFGEFCLAWSLIQNQQLPFSIPPSIIREIRISQQVPTALEIKALISPLEMEKTKRMFKKYQVDNLIQAQQCKNILSASNLANAVLAQIWSIANPQDGFLNEDGFIVAMYCTVRCRQLISKAPQNIIDVYLFSLVHSHHTKEQNEFAGIADKMHQEVYLGLGEENKKTLTLEELVEMFDEKSKKYCLGPITPAALALAALNLKLKLHAIKTEQQKVTKELLPNMQDSTKELDLELEEFKREMEQYKEFNETQVRIQVKKAKKFLEKKEIKNEFVQKSELKETKQKSNDFLQEIKEKTTKNNDFLQEIKEKEFKEFKNEIKDGIKNNNFLTEIKEKEVKVDEIKKQKNNDFLTEIKEKQLKNNKEFLTKENELKEIKPEFEDKNEQENDFVEDKFRNVLNSIMEQSQKKNVQKLEIKTQQIIQDLRSISLIQKPETPLISVHSPSNPFENTVEVESDQEVEYSPLEEPSPVLIPCKFKQKATKSFHSQNNDELSFECGDEVEILDDETESWYVGRINSLVGWVPISHFEKPEKNKKRKAALREFLETESSFLLDLKQVMDVYYPKLLQHKHIFLNLPEILTNSTNLLKELQNNDLGLVLQTNLHVFQALKEFCLQMKQSAEHLNKIKQDKKYDELLKNLSLNMMNLGSYFLKPMQRLTRYSLLLKQILKFTPEQHDDYENLKLSLEHVQLILKETNKEILDQENKRVLQKLIEKLDTKNTVDLSLMTKTLGPRSILHFGILEKAKSKRKLHAYLFNDMFLLCVAKKDTTFVMYREPIALDSCTVQRDSQADVFWVKESKSRALGFRTLLNQRNQWVQKIEDALLEFKKPVFSSKPIGNLRVFVIEAKCLPHTDYGSTPLTTLCEVSVSSQKQQTKGVRSSLNPKWKQELLFKVFSLDDSLRLVVFSSHDRYSQADYLGTAELPLHHMEYFNEQETTQELPLHNVIHGSIKITVQFKAIN